MKRRFLIIAAIWPGAGLVSTHQACIAAETTVCNQESGAQVNCPVVATAEKTATYLLRDSDPAAEALQLTARPLAADPRTGYLVQVYASSGNGTLTGSMDLLGSFSFYPAKVGQKEIFVLPKPSIEPTAGSPVTLSIKLIAANAAATLKNSAVEITDVRLVK